MENLIFYKIDQIPEVFAPEAAYLDASGYAFVGVLKGSDGIIKAAIWLGRPPTQSTHILTGPEPVRFPTREGVLIPISTGDTGWNQIPALVLPARYGATIAPEYKVAAPYQAALIEAFELGELA